MLQEFSKTEEEIQVTKMLLKVGAKGSSQLNERLLSLVREILGSSGRKKPTSLYEQHLKCLLKGKASVDFEAGAVIKDSVRARNVFLVDKLRQARPSVHAITESLAIACNLPHQGNSDSSSIAPLVRSLLETGRDISGQALHNAIVDVVDKRLNDYQALEILVDHGARLSSTYDEAFLLHALQRCNREVFALLVRTITPRAQILGTALYNALEDLAKAEVLLEHGCPQQEVDNLLSSELKKLNGNIRLVELLIKYDANVSRARGEALQTTYEKGDREAFGILLSANLTKEALGWTLKFAVRALRPDGNYLLPVLLEAAFDQQDLDQALSDAARGAEPKTQRPKITRIRVLCCWRFNTTLVAYWSLGSYLPVG